jgi:hypothetical protein
LDPHGHGNGYLIDYAVSSPVDVDPALEVVRTHGNGKSSPAMLVSVRSFPRRTGGRTRKPGKKGATIFLQETILQPINGCRNVVLLRDTLTGCG